VRVQQVCGAEETVGVRDHGDDVELGLEQLAQLVRHRRMIVGQEHTRASHPPSVGAERCPALFAILRRERSGKDRRETHESAAMEPPPGARAPPLASLHGTLVQYAQAPAMAIIIDMFGLVPGALAASPVTP